MRTKNPAGTPLGENVRRGWNREEAKCPAVCCQRRPITEQQAGGTTHPHGGAGSCQAESRQYRRGGCQRSQVKWGSRRTLATASGDSDGPRVVRRGCGAGTGHPCRQQPEPGAGGRFTARRLFFQPIILKGVSYDILPINTPTATAAHRRQAGWRNPRSTPAAPRPRSGMDGAEGIAARARPDAEPRRHRRGRRHASASSPGDAAWRRSARFRPKASCRRISRCPARSSPRNTPWR